MLLACVYRVMDALGKCGEHSRAELLSAAPRATLMLLSCSPNFSRASITQYMHAKHEPIVNYTLNYICKKVIVYFFIN